MADTKEFLRTNYNTTDEFVRVDGSNDDRLLRSDNSIRYVEITRGPLAFTNEFARVNDGFDAIESLPVVEPAEQPATAQNIWQWKDTQGNLHAWTWTDSEGNTRTFGWQPGG